MVAEVLGVNRKSIYYQSKLTKKDEGIRDEINEAHLFNPAYGHKRLALHLGYGKNRVRRIMKKFGIKPPRRKMKNHWITVSTDNHSYTNLIKNITAFKPAQIFVSDLTYLEYQGKKYCLATVEDIFTREILAANVSDRHDSALALATIQKAVGRNRPEVFHSDQGTEFMAQTVTDFLTRNNIKVSVSDKGSPWQNGYKESFFDKFKTEMGDLDRFDSLGELAEEIYSYIYYYNNLRIHTKLKMPPALFKRNYTDFVSQKMGT